MNSYKELQEVVDTLNTCLSANSDGYLAKNLNIPLTRDQAESVRFALEVYLETLKRMNLPEDSSNIITLHYQDGEI